MAGRRKVRIDEDLLRKLWAEGLSICDMSERLHAAERTIQRVVKDLDLPPRSGRSKPAEQVPRAWQPGQVDRVNLPRLWRDGVPTAEIADRMGVKPPAVARAARQMELPPRKSGPRTDLHRPVKAAPVPASYATVAEQAAAEGLTLTQALQRFHRTRAAKRGAS